MLFYYIVSNWICKIREQQGDTTVQNRFRTMLVLVVAMVAMLLVSVPVGADHSTL